MRSIYIRNLLKSYLKKKKTILLCLIVLILAFGALGVRQAYPEKVSSSLAEEVGEYEDALKQYDDAIANIEDNIEISQDQVDKQQKYCDESVFMQIDPTNVQTAGMQYMITVPDMMTTAASSQITYILNAWTTYINGGSLKSELANELGNISTEYLSELITCTAAGNTFTITVRHYDMEAAKDILNRLDEKISAHRSVVENSLGNFEMIVLDSSSYALADMTVQNTQSTNLKNLQTYKNTLTDFKTKLVTQRTQKNNYQQQYKPAGVSTKSPKRTLAEYGALGVAAGIILPFALYAIYYTLSGRIKDKDELLAAGLNVIASCHPKKGFSPSAKRAAADIGLLAKQSGASSVCISRLSPGEEAAKAAGEISALLKEKDLEIIEAEPGKETPEDLLSMSQAGNAVLFIETGQTTYTQLEEQMQFCQRFHITVWGCVVIE